MTTPIACTLTAAQYRRRLTHLADLARQSLRARRPIDGGERLVFAADAGTERDLRAAVAAEAGCCAFLTMDLRREDGALVLDVTGPEGTGPIVADLFTAA